MTAVSEVAICNMALHRVGGSSIADLDEDTKAGRVCNAFYDHARDFVLASYPWKCIMKRARAAQLTSSPAFEYDYSYQVPSDCLGWIRCGDAYGFNDEIDFVVEGDKIHTDETELYIQYARRETDPTKFDALLVQSIACYMAYLIAVPLQASIALQNAKYQEFLQTVQQAERVNAIDVHDTSIEKTDGYLDARE